jgi:ATP-dependent DNA helicase RecQ
VRSLKEVGIASAYLNSSLTTNQFFTALNRAREGAYKIIYVAPERLETESFIEFAVNAPIAMVTVDEAHCISQWGQDFRPSYLRITEFVKKLPRRPVVSAFTATATSVVQEDIVRSLELVQPSVLVTGFDRSNLYYEVQQPKNKMDAVLAYVEQHADVSGIIYCATRKNVEEVCEVLVAQGYPATRYHAGLSDQERTENQNAFIYDEKPIMVATNAFGMGIDKSNVRYVLHYNMPKNMESYYQEAGRAGRDGEDAECVLLYHAQDVVINQLFIDKGNQNQTMDYATAQLVRQQDIKRLKQMSYYCLTKDCLREYILKYFGERSEHYCGNCSNCLQEYEEVDVSDVCRLVLGCVAECRRGYGATTIIECLRGMNSQKIKRMRLDENTHYGSCVTQSKGYLHNIVNMLILDGYLISTEGQYPVLQMTHLGQQFLNDSDGFITMKLAREEYVPKSVSHDLDEGSQKRRTQTKANGSSKSARKTKIKTSSKAKRKRQNTALSAENQQLFEQLRRLRMKLARQQGLPPYMIFADKTLTDMCVRRPHDADEMLQVGGVGAVKYEHYGEEFLAEIARFERG